MSGLDAEKIVEQTRRLRGAEATDIGPGAPKCDWLRLQRFAEASGDENPLYLDPCYGAGSRWGTMLAPPAFVLAIRAPESRGSTAATRCFGHLSEMEINWDDHLHLGDRIGSSLRIMDCTAGMPKDGKETALVHSEATYARDGKAFARAHGVMEIRPPDTPVVTRQVHQYDDEELARMIAELDAESSRHGWHARYWDEVRPGDRLPRRLRGPLTWSELITWIIAEGRPIKAGNLRHLEALQEGAFMTVHPATKWPHWPIEEAREDFLASQALAMPAPFARGGLIVALVCTMLTDWMGDDGFLRRLKIVISQPFLYGDVCRFSGMVRDRFEGKNLGGFGVYVDFEVCNQLDERVAHGEASILLPRPGRPVELPADIGLARDGASV